MSIRARDISDLCDDLGLERASVTVKEGWDHDQQFFLTFGPMAYRQLVEIDPKLDMVAVKAKLEAAKAAPLCPEAVFIRAEAAKLARTVPPFPNHAMPAPEAKSPPAATLGTAKGKRKKAGEIA